jgi:hypothetical protein
LNAPKEASVLGRVIQAPVSLGTIEHGSEGASAKPTCRVEREAIPGDVCLGRSRPESDFEEPGAQFASSNRDIVKLTRLLGNRHDQSLARTAADVWRSSWS